MEREDNNGGYDYDRGGHTRKREDKMGDKFERIRVNKRG